ncbi:hypothetical protein RJ639_027736 [Escallonia herrerae]|uniref:GDSL esterase/lipase n=1 Tax=Escallonia herrerae TaxID=1293975 RepID=A0AA89BQ66_9ASTE|nr:hypothetical protein RJ639_027736 [Escallonia herrerae]
MNMMMMRVFFIVAVMALHAQGVDIPHVRQLVAKNNVTSILVFGDSSVDPGNNNHLATTNKGNFPPYGKDFLNGSHPTGRFTNGRLATDFIAEAIGYTKIIPGFLDPHMKKADLLHGVSFASAGSGYDDLTANLTTVLSVAQQLKYFMHYKIHLREMVGEKRAKEIVSNAIVVLSMGTNDFLQNYYVEPIRSEQYSVEKYQKFLISSMFRDVKAMYRLGARRLVVVGVPPLGCFPLVKTLRDETECDKILNTVSLSFNSQIIETLATLEATTGMKTAFVDIYHVILNAIQNPKRYGFAETSKGCCGSGTLEYGETCRGLSTCADPTKYIYWDAVHPTEKMYKIIADEALNSLINTMFK